MIFVTFDPKIEFLLKTLFLFFPNFRYTTDFTSVSQQNHFASRYALQNQPNNKGANSKPYWTREKRKRYRRQRSPPSSFLSSTFDDTEVSMSVDVITVFIFNLKNRNLRTGSIPYPWIFLKTPLNQGVHFCKKNFLGAVFIFQPF